MEVDPADRRVRQHWGVRGADRLRTGGGARRREPVAGGRAAAGRAILGNALPRARRRPRAARCDRHLGARSSRAARARVVAPAAALALCVAAVRRRGGTARRAVFAVSAGALLATWSATIPAGLQG